jgi:hypothetical protein
VIVTAISDPLVDYEIHLWIDDYAIVPQVISEFASLVWYQSHRHNVPLPNPAQDLFLFDGNASAESVPSHGEIRNALSGSPLLASLDDADLDRLAHSTSFARYAVGEVLSDSANPSRDLVVMVEGQARMVLHRPDGTEAVFGELADGDIVGLLGEQSIDGHDIRVRAVTDCQVAAIEGETLEEVASRSVDLAAAFNRMSSIRRRRAERMIGSPPEPERVIGAESPEP